MRQDPILIKAYDPAWAAMFEAQRQVVTDALDGLLARPVEHIGSTSVPGLPAKAIVDMLAVVENYELAVPGLRRLEEAGWVLAPEPGDEAARKYSICYPSIERRTHHLHIVEPDWGWQEILLFRDHLRAHPDTAAEYAALKRRLAAADDRDRVRYRAAKAPFIRAVLEAAARP